MTHSVSRILLVVAWISSLAGVALAADFDQEKLNNWHQWRGPLANGFAPDADPPTTWDQSSNIKWKVEVPGQGESTPIVWGNRIFLTTAIKTEREEEQPPAETAEAPGGNPFKIERPTHYYKFVAQCYDRATGKLLWEKMATEQVPHEGHHKDHGYASASPITDGQAIYASFGSRGLYCWDLDGSPRWDRDFGDMKMYRFFGEASTPALDGETLYLIWDHEGDSWLYALDTRTGKTRWQVEREPGSSWTTPLVVDFGGRKQVVVNSNKKARGYDAETGKVLWECGGQTRAIIPCPITYDGRVFLMSGYPESAMVAVPLDASGDITGTDKILWSRNQDTPYCPSAVLVGSRLYFNKSNSAIWTSLEAGTGKPVVEKQRLPDIRNIYASPVAAAGRIYITDRDGTTLVLADAPEVKVLATNKLDAPVDASPALVGNEIILRSKQHLYCISAN
ncbi:MAG: PQQ-binding-like beta-propeller repeat protein [Pirellulales bacterium]